MKKQILCILIPALVLVNANAQEDLDPINTGSANFLTITPDARSAAMGGAGVTLSGSDNAIFYNGSTALLNDERKGGVTYTYIPWMRDFQSGYSINSLGGFYKVNSKNAILAGIRYYNYPNVPVLGDYGEQTGKIKPKELSVDVGYARELTPNLAVSGTFRFIHSDMGKVGDAKSANAVAFDIGMLYKQNMSIVDGAKWAAGFQLSNVGTKIKYLDSKEHLPMMAKVGGSVEVPFYRLHKILVTTDFGYRIQPSDISSFNISAGAEYTFIDHFMLRGGYHYGDKKKADTSYATAGLGISYFGAHLDFSWLFAENDNPWRNTFWISLGYSF